MPNKFRFDLKIKKVTNAKKELPKLLANQAQNFFVDNFKRQGFLDGAVKKWKEVQRRIKGTPEYMYPKRRDLSRRRTPILIRSGKLRRAVGSSAKVITAQRIKFIVPLKYAAAQNDGNSKRNLVPRKFMGDSKTLRKMQRDLIRKKTGGALNAK